MTPRLINGIPAKDIVNPLPDNEALVERIGHRKVKLDISLSPPDPTWPAAFEAYKARIEAAVDVLTIRHVGSTSVPNLPAKPVIDIDLVVPDITSEAYVTSLEAAGFQFLLREPWYEHRFFVATDPPCNLHVWGPNTPEVERHRIFKEWLIAHDDDRELYAQTKVECAKASQNAGEDMQQYTLRKDQIVSDILQRAFKDLGLLEG